MESHTAYVRFEIFLPTDYTIKLRDDQGVQQETLVSLPTELLHEFIIETVGLYGGFTEANPHGAAPYKGWWQSTKNNSISIDYLTYFVGLVRAAFIDKAVAHFSQWKSRFENALNQEIVLVMYFPVNVLGVI